MAEIFELPKRDVGDIPSMMEVIAQEIRSGEHGDIRAGAAVFLDGTGELLVCGWGKDGHAIQSIGMFHMAASWLANNITKR